MPIPARADVIARAGEILLARKAELAELVSRECGKILIEAGGDVQEAVDMANFVAGQGRAAWGETVPSELGSKLCWTTRAPVGVIGMITPWNFPVAIPSWKCFPALLAGNGIVLKPSEHSPACAEAFVDACLEAGVPEGLIQLVHGFAEPAAALAVHPGVGAVSFTGSVPTGRKVAAAAMETGPRLVSLELGGKNAMVVRPDADLDLVVDGAIFGAFGTSGQRCTSTSRLIVHPDVADELVERIAKRAGELRLGDPTRPATDVGPVINRASADRIHAMVDAAIAEGATVASGGRRALDVARLRRRRLLRADRPDRRASPHHRIAREEVFGPVLSVMEVADLDDALDVVNSVEYGLSSCIYTRDINTALYAVDRIDAGIVYVNAPTIGAEIPLPFGGTKHTGNGFREAGARGIEQFSQIKTVYIDYSGRLQRAQIDTPGVECTEEPSDHLPAPSSPSRARRRPSGWPATRPPWPASSPAAPTSSPCGARARGCGTPTGRRYLDFASGIAVDQHRPLPPEGGGGHRRAGGHADPHVGGHPPPPGWCELAERLGGLVPLLRRAAGVLLQLRRRGGRRLPEAGPQGHRQAGRHRLPPGLPRPDPGGHVSLTTAKGKYREGYEPLLPACHHRPLRRPRRASTSCSTCQAPGANIGAP